MSAVPNMDSNSYNLVRYDAARRALMDAHTVDEVKEIKDQALALEIYARQRKDVQMERWLAEIKLRAELRIGELSRELERTDEQTRFVAQATPGRSTAETPSKTAVLAQAGISKSMAHRAETLAKSADVVETYIGQQAAKGKTVSIDGALQSALRNSERAKRREAAAQSAQIEGTYSVVLADPPWRYGATSVTGSAEHHYPTMSTEAIYAEPIKDHVTDDAALFLWATNPLLPDALKVIAAWGFAYRTNIVWVKEKPTTGLGTYVRGQHELLLIATRGRMIPEQRPSSVLLMPEFDPTERGKHSRKPHVVYEIIEQMYPGQVYMEHFARPPHPRSWKVFGAESQP